MRFKDKLKALGTLLQRVEQQFGQGALRSVTPALSAPHLAPFSSGSLALDQALGIGGYPRGRVVEIFGPASSGKSTLALHAIRSCQEQEGIAAFVDAEHALDLHYAEKLGIDLTTMLLSQPAHGEQAFDIIDMLLRSEAIDLIVVDSVAALLPQAELDSTMSDEHVGKHARLMSQALRRLVGHIARSQTTVIFVNQIRHKVGVFFGTPETTTGGNALPFFASLRLDIRRQGPVKSGGQVIGNQVRVSVVKHKLAPPGQEASFEILYGHGINQAGELLDLGLAHKLIKKSGAHYRYEQHELGRGRIEAYEALRHNPELLHQLRHALSTKLSTTQEQSRDTPRASTSPKTTSKKKAKKAAASRA